ncbi:hypothetical protein LCGC14_2733500, partial [marine sediment metagenome]
MTVEYIFYLFAPKALENFLNLHPSM